MAPTTTVIDAGKDLPDNYTPTFAKEPFFLAVSETLCFRGGLRCPSSSLSRHDTRTPRGGNADTPRFLQNRLVKGYALRRFAPIKHGSYLKKDLGGICR